MNESYKNSDTENHPDAAGAPKVIPLYKSLAYSENFDFTCYDLAGLQARQVAAVVGRKDFLHR